MASPVAVPDTTDMGNYSKACLFKAKPLEDHVYISMLFLWSNFAISCSFQINPHAESITPDSSYTAP